MVIFERFTILILKNDPVQQRGGNAFHKSTHVLHLTILCHRMDGSHYREGRTGEVEIFIKAVELVSDRV